MSVLQRPRSSMSTQTCPECQATPRPDGVEQICPECGLVVESDEIDHGPEWRAFDDNRENPQRVGAPRTPRQHDNGLGSTIWATGSLGEKWGRLRTHNRRGKFETKRDRNRASGLGEVQRITDYLELGDSVTDRACYLWQCAHTAGCASGRSIEGVAAAAVLTAVREQRCPVTTTDIREASRLDEDRLVPLYHEVANVTNATPLPAEPVLFVDRLASDVGADDEERRTARQVTVAAQEEGLHNGCKPIGMAAGAIAVATESWINLSDLADTASISRRTLRTRRKEIREAGLLEQRGDQA